MKSIIALDLGTQTGWAMNAPGFNIVSGSASFRVGAKEGSGMRFLRFQAWLAELRNGIGADVDAIFFEDVRRHNGTDAAHVYGGLKATLTAFCEQHHIPYLGVGVGVIKKHYTGTGSARKEEMMRAAIKAGHHPKDDNEADALALLDFAIVKLKGSTDLRNGVLL